MKFRYWGALLAFTLAACSGQTQQSSTSSSSPMPGESGAMSTERPAAGRGDIITFQLKPMNGSGESGTATLTRLGSKTRVVISIKGENATGKQPAHVHLGTCAKLDPKPKYPLHDVVLGKSNTVIDEPLDELMGTASAINIHESAQNLGKYVSCGDIP